MRNATILIVEDDAILAMSLRKMISFAGYTVAGPLATGGEAIAFLSKQSVDLVVMDIELAGTMNGITAAKKIYKTSGVPVVFLTGFSNEFLLEQAKGAAPYGYLVKPVSEQELIATLDMALHRHMLHRELESTLSYVKHLEGVLPVCVYCKKIRDDSGSEPGGGQWMQMEEFLRNKCGTAVSHGCCPECFATHRDDD